jgi:hypothetical protein
MNLIARLFSKTPSVQELRDQVKEIDQEQRRKRRDLVMLDQAKQEKVKKAVEAKKAGRQELLRDIFRDVSQVEIDLGNANSDLRRLSLTKTALTSFIRKAEMLESNKDRKSLQSLVKRFQDSSIQKTIDSAAVDDDTFNIMLEDVLGEEEGATTQVKGKEDSGFADFERAIGQMAKADEPGADEPEPSRMQDRSQASARGLKTQDTDWDAERKRIEDLSRDRLPWDDAMSPDKDKQLDFQQKAAEEQRRIEDEMKRIQERGEAAKDDLRRPNFEDAPVPGTPDPGIASARSTRSHPAQEPRTQDVKLWENEMTRLQDEADRLQKLGDAAMHVSYGIRTMDADSDLQAQEKAEELQRAMEAAARLLQEQQEAAKRALENIRTMDSDSDLETQKKAEELQRAMEAITKLLQEQQEAAKRALENIRTMDSDSDLEAQKKAEELQRAMEAITKLLQEQQEAAKHAMGNIRG